MKFKSHPGKEENKPQRLTPVVILSQVSHYVQCTVHTYTLSMWHSNRAGRGYQERLEDHAYHIIA